MGILRSDSNTEEATVDEKLDAILQSILHLTNGFANICSSLGTQVTLQAGYMEALQHEISKVSTYTEFLAKELKHTSDDNKIH